ncbi:ABC transporter ATPase [Arcticibacter eurypsychrophilus]|uniref:ABC transporter ATPase n=1 Tax=Arcticibacter eurypsychrophilus TaxID=1434752 RepID=UPI0009F57A9A|nr:ABC transporter ATPase [Arcticibacter eurypsychrophilus]
MEFSQNSKVWIYQSNRPFAQEEQVKIEKIVAEFATEWQAHGVQLKARSEIRYNRFIIFMVDEIKANASGCSIDRSADFIKELEAEYKVSLFDRFNMAYKTNEEVISCNRDEFEVLLNNGIIKPDTIVFNNMVHTKAELDTNWEIPFNKSWHARVFA